MNKRLWHSTTTYVPGPQSVQPPVRQNFTKAACRRMAMYDSRRPGANFKCPRCRTYFYLTYGVFGKFGTFEDPTHYCRDCADNSGFVKIK